MIWLKIMLGLYALGFVLMSALQASIGPVTLGLAFVRAVAWPIFLATGWPHGAPLPMD